MRILIYIEPTSYILSLWHKIKSRSNVETRIIFLEENLTQPWDIDLLDDPQVEVLHGSWLKKLMRLVQLIIQRDVDLVALAGWGHSLLMVGFLFAWIWHIPITMESDTQYDPRKSWWRLALKQIFFPIFFRIPRIFFPAGTRQSAYFKRYGVSQSRIQIAKMTVDVRLIMERVDQYRVQNRLGLSVGTPTVFLFVGRLEIYKGISDLFDAFISLIKEGGKCRLLIVGDGSLRDLVESARNTYVTIEYLGRLSGESLMHAYSQADVFILPSRVEPWGLTINEAMAAGLAVITTDTVGCVDDLVCEGKNGYIVPSASPASLAEAMSAFIYQPEMAVSMGQISRQIISNWTIEDEARILMTTWDKLT